VHPRNKGKEIGTALVEAGLEQARRMGLPVLTVSYRSSMGVYERLGFKVMGRVEKDDREFGGEGEYSWFFMVWEGKDAEGHVVMGN
jgi:predicted N-acetyltransferase YhbS